MPLPREGQLWNSWLVRMCREASRGPIHKPEVGQTLKAGPRPPTDVGWALAGNLSGAEAGGPLLFGTKQEPRRLEA